MPKKWVLLIGIDRYAQGNHRNPVYFRDLSACVRDVETLESYFRNQLYVDKIIKLISPLDRTVDACDLPTWKNIERALRHIADNGHRGDVVYIHYSGHGIRRSSTFPREKGDNISGTALVPMDVMQGGAYMSGYQLGCLVKRLVRRRMRVAVTLDSCHSGRGLRNSDEGIRTSASPYDESMAPSDLEADTSIRDMESEGHGENGHRNANARLSWLVDPEDCAVLTACEFDETASESTFHEGRFGVLTYFILQLLRQSPPSQLPSYEKLADHARRRCIEQRFLQTPVIHGDSEFEFFGTRHIFQRPVCHLSCSSGTICADIGWASGVAVGAIYELQQQSADSQKERRLLHVTQTFEYTSIMQLLSDKPAAPQALEGTHHAFQVSWALPQPMRIRIKFEATNGDVTNTKQLFKTQLEGLGNFIVTSERSNYKLSVSLDHRHRYKIKDSQSKTLRGIPKIDSRDEGHIEKLTHLIYHLARYTSIQDGPPRHMSPSTLSSTVVFEILSPDGHAWPRDQDGTYRAADGDTIMLKLTDLMPRRSLHVAIFNLNPTWGIEKIFPGGPQPSEKTDGLQPVTIHDLNMEVPSHVKGKFIMDTLRAYIYVGPVAPSWNELALPDLPKEAHSLARDHLVECLESDSSVHSNRHVRPSKNKSINTGSYVQADGWVWIDVKVRTSRRQRRGEADGYSSASSVE